MYYAKEGTPIKAKYAATIVAHDTARPGATDDLVAVRPLTWSSER